MRKITWRGESKAGIAIQIVNIMCFLEGDYVLFQNYVNLHAQKQWIGFA